MPGKTRPRIESQSGTLHVPSTIGHRRTRRVRCASETRAKIVAESTRYGRSFMASSRSVVPARILRSSSQEGSREHDDSVNGRRTVRQDVAAGGRIQRRVAALAEDDRAERREPEGEAGGGCPPEDLDGQGDVEDAGEREHRKG